MHKTNSTSPNICETCPDLAELGQTRHKADIYKGHNKGNQPVLGDIVRYMYT